MHAAAAKSLQSCPTLCDPTDGSPPGSPVPGILQARTLEWIVISFSNAWKWKVKVKSLNRFRLLATPWTVAYQAPPSMGFSRQEYRSGLPLPSPTFDFTFHPAHCCWKYKLVQPLWQTVWRFLKKLKLALLWYSAFPPLSIHLKKMKSVSQKDICTPHLLQFIYNSWDMETTQVSFDRWMDKENMIKKKKIFHRFTTTWMNLEGTILSEINQADKVKKKKKIPHISKITQHLSFSD